MNDSIPSIIAGRYEVIEEIGQGGMGAVYRVKHISTRKLLALKLLHPHVVSREESLAGFQREMAIPAKIDSEHVVEITDADAAPELGAPFLVMELLKGCDLSKVMQLQKLCTAEEVVWVLSQTARALDKAHALGIVHRDIKPENLFLHQHGDSRTLMVKVLDFGIAKLTEAVRKSGGANSMIVPGGQASGKDSLLSSGGTKAAGTPLYMAPEQAQADNKEIKVGPAADIWALGMMTFELLTGQTYWQVENAFAIMGQLLFSPIVRPSTRSTLLPAKFDDWFMRSCDRDPEKRWPSAGAQAKALAMALGLTVHPSKVPGSNYAPATAPRSLQQTVQLVLNKRSRDKLSKLDELGDTVPKDRLQPIRNTEPETGDGVPQPVPDYEETEPYNGLGPVPGLWPVPPLPPGPRPKPGPGSSTDPDPDDHEDPIDGTLPGKKPKPSGKPPQPDRDAPTVGRGPKLLPPDGSGTPLPKPEPPGNIAFQSWWEAWLSTQQARLKALRQRWPWLQVVPLDTLRWIIIGAASMALLLLLGSLLRTAIRPTAVVAPADMSQPASLPDLSEPVDLLPPPEDLLPARPKVKPRPGKLPSDQTGKVRPKPLRKPNLPLPKPASF